MDEEIEPYKSLVLSIVENLEIYENLHYPESPLDLALAQEKGNPSVRLRSFYLAAAL